MADIIPFPSPAKQPAESQIKPGDCTSHEPQGASMVVLAEQSERADRPFIATATINGKPIPLSVS